MIRPTTGDSLTGLILLPRHSHRYLVPLVTLLIARVRRVVRVNTVVQPRRGARGRRPYGLQVASERRDMAEFAARAGLLAVEVELHARLGRHHVVDAFVQPHAALRTAEHVHHHDPRRGATGVAEWIVEHGPQML